MYLCDKTYNAILYKINLDIIFVCKLIIDIFHYIEISQIQFALYGINYRYNLI